VSTVAGWLAEAIEGERRLRGHVDRLVAARRALHRPAVAALEVFLREEAPAALAAVDALLQVDVYTLTEAMAQWRRLRQVPPFDVPIATGSAGRTTW
jgi:predicted RNA-binding Zn ribbon-like protein